MIDDSRARRAGVRKLAGQHLELYTDLASDPEVDALPAVFDRAVPLWAEYFGVDERKTRDWQVRAFLIGNREPFDALGLMPATNEEFPHGLSIGSELWLYDQPTAYYRRHLLLHEGTHAFMWRFLGGCGPGWYMEGMAELLATHRLDSRNGELTLGIMPADRREVPMLGRIKLIRDAVAADRARSLAEVMQIDNRHRLDNEAYAWCWAAAKFLDAHPRYGKRFRELKQHVRDPDFNRVVRREFANDWPELADEWPAFVATLDHGYDSKRMAISFEDGQPVQNRSRRATVDADRGWQSSGVWLEAGRTYHIRARGRYQIAAEPTDAGLQPWPCEPGGVTIEYYNGRPLGMLLAAVDSRTEVEGGRGRAEEETEESNWATFARPVAVGLGAIVKLPQSGTLYLRVNDSAGRLDDNRGKLTVVIESISRNPASR